MGWRILRHGSFHEIACSVYIVHLRWIAESQNPEVFEATEDLQYLDLSSTKVVGDIQVFKSAAKLKSLYLSATEIFGDIAAFNKTDSFMLEALYLGQTNVSGNISTLWAADMLEKYS